MLRDDVPAQPLLGLAVAAAHPRDVQAAPEARQAYPDSQECLRQRDLGGKGDRQEKQGSREEQRPGGAQPRSGGVRDGPPHDSAGLGLLSEQGPAPEGQRKQGRDREKEQDETCRLGSRVGKRPLPETPPTPEEEQGGDGPGRQAENRVESR